MIDLEDNTMAMMSHAASMVPCDTSAERIQWVHRMYGSPAAATFINAWDKGWIKVPGITSRAVKQHRALLHSIQSAEGHLDQSRKNAYSTSKSYASRQARKDGDDSQPLQPTHVFTQTSETNHMDATGRFPYKSQQGKQYNLIMYSENGNFIKVITMKDRTKEEFAKAYKTGHQFFVSRGLAPTFQRLDNEISNDLRRYLTKHGITLDLAPPGQHRRNRAERAIRTFKNHFIAILAGVDPTFPANLWCTLIQQAEITMNLLRESTCNPRMSAWEEINGPLDFSKTPMAPPGMRVTVHDKPSARGSWAKHGTPAFYTGPAPDHHRCYTTHVKESGATRVTDTLAWHPHGFEMPTATPLELVKDAATTFSQAMRVLAEANIVSANHRQPLHVLVDTMEASLLDLVTLFKEDTPAANQRVPSDDVPHMEPELNTTPLPVTLPTTQPNQRVPERVRNPDNDSLVPPGFSLTDVPEVLPIGATNVPQKINNDIDVTDPITNQRSPEITQKSDITVKSKTTSENVEKTKTPPPTTAKITPSSRRRSQRKQKLNHRYMHAAYQVVDIEHARALMIQQRFQGNMQGGRTRRREPTKRRRKPSRGYLFQAVNKMNTTPEDDWDTWATSDNVELDSAGVPFFTSNPTMETPTDQEISAMHTANTAVDLDGKGKKLTFSIAMQGEEKDIWLHEHGKEICKLIDTKTARPRHWHDLPSGKKATYYSPQVKTKIKDGVKVYRVRGTIGGNHIDYQGDTQAFTAAMQTIKILLNAVVSGNAKFMTADIKDFYLGTPLAEHEWMRVELKQIPLDIQEKYDLPKYAKNGAVLFEIMKGIYGLPQAGKLAQDRLVAHLATHGYHQAKHTPCLFIHETRNIAFTLVVDDFGIKYTDDADAKHLLACLRELYVMTEDWAEEQKYVGITVKHDRTANIITLSMPGYVEKALARFGASDIKGANSPITYVPPIRGQKVQMALMPEEDDNPLTAAEITRIQEIVGVFLFYSRAVDSTMLTALSKISTQQAAPTQRTVADTNRFLQYAKQMQNNELIIHPSDMQLKAQSDASYLSETLARSRAGMLLYFGINKDGTVNGIIDAASCIIPTVCSSVAEAEYAALFLVGKEIVSARHTLYDLGYPQGSTIIKCDNSCAVGIANVTVKQKRSKAIDMRYHWIRDQVQQGKVTVTWEAGVLNLADFFTKAHPVWHHKAMVGTFVHVPKRTSIVNTTRSRRIARLKDTISKGHTAP
jgi:hypothetical protein